PRRRAYRLPRLHQVPVLRGLVVSVGLPALGAAAKIAGRLLHVAHLLAGLALELLALVAGEPALELLELAHDLVFHPPPPPFWTERGPAVEPPFGLGRGRARRGAPAQGQGVDSGSISTCPRQG